MTFDEVVAGRRSIRKYRDEALPRQALLAVLEAGRLAPSARNDQVWRFTAVENAALREKLAEACCGQAFVAGAPASIVVWGQEGRLMKCGQPVLSIDGSIATCHMMLKAAELGLGSCWLGAFDPEAVKQVLGLPKDATVVAVLPVGYADEAPAARPRKGADEIYEIRE